MTIVSFTQRNHFRYTSIYKILTDLNELIFSSSLCSTYLTDELIKHRCNTISVLRIMLQNNTEINFIFFIECNSSEISQFSAKNLKERTKIQ